MSRGTIVLGGQLSRGTNVWGDKCPGGTDVLGGHLSRGTVVQGDNCPGGQMSGGQMSGGHLSGGQMSHHPRICVLTTSTSKKKLGYVTKGVFYSTSYNEC